MNEKQEQIVLSNGEVASVKPTKSFYPNNLIVELEGILRVEYKETKTIARLREKHIINMYTEKFS